jgi:type II secretory pathway component GspD/PulD (secretin)
MRSILDETAMRLRCIGVFTGVMTIAMMLGPNAGAQTQPAEEKAVEAKQVPQIYETFFLANASQQTEVNDIQTDLRNMIPRSRIYAVMTPTAISVQGSAEDLALAKRIIAELDHPRKTYRLIYTITESEGGKPTRSEHFSVVVVAGATTVLKQGGRAPIVTGSSDAGSGKTETQVQYVDVGLSIDASLDGERLYSKIEQSSLADDKVVADAKDPMIRQSVLEGMSNLSTEKAVVLGTLDIPGGTRHEEIAVAVELVP